MLLRYIKNILRTSISQSLCEKKKFNPQKFLRENFSATHDLGDRRKFLIFAISEKFCEFFWMLFI